MHQFTPSTNPFFEIGIQRNYPGHQGLLSSLFRAPLKKKKEWGWNALKQDVESSQEFHGILSWNRDQRFGAEIVSPAHQSFQGNSFTWRFQGDYRVVSADRPVSADYFAAFFS